MGSLIIGAILLTLLPSFLKQGSSNVLGYPIVVAIWPTPELRNEAPPMSLGFPFIRIPLTPAL
jgi:hypothetical protein